MIEEFLRESNAIEGVYDQDSLNQATLAWKYLQERDDMTLELVKKVHKILMLNQKLEKHEIGNFRMVPVWIGGREAINSSDVSIAIEEWCEEMNDPLKNPFPDDESKTLHVDYEKIHPFIDGNGRTGRMFMNWWRIKNNLPLLVIHEGKEQMEYYKWFK